MTSADLWKQDEREAAVAFAELNLESFPESGSTHTLLGQVYAELGDRDRAITHLETALEINPRNPAARRAFESLRGAN
ncbi:MAG: tetratricopeptide repeat protein [Gemmatimonadales bacterium]